MTLILKNVRLHFPFLMPRGGQLVRYLVGYNPQKLLPDHRGTVEHTAYAWRQMDVARWNEADSDPLGDIQRWMDSFYPRTPTFDHKMAIIPAGTDFAAIEKRIMATIDRQSVRCVILDFDEPGGDILSPYSHAEAFFPRGMMLDKPEAVETSQGMRDKSYLKHDPSKKHKRRKR